MTLYAFDGTGDKPEELDFGFDCDKSQGVDNTNVIHVREIYKRTHGEDKIMYKSGPGTRMKFWGKFFGGVGGAGSKKRVKEAIKEAEKRIKAGDEIIDVVGFSRGAAIATHFAHVITQKTFENQRGERVQPTVRFLALFDTVGSFGIPGPYINLFWKLSLPPNDRVQACAHALAMDERRQFFRPSRIKGEEGATSAYEVWFRGTHGDIGGGNCNAGRYCISLLWMLQQANARGGWDIPEHEFETVKQNINLHAPVNWDLEDPAQNAFREVEPTDVFHRSLDEEVPPPSEKPLRDLPGPKTQLSFVD